VRTRRCQGRVKTQLPLEWLRGHPAQTQGLKEQLRKVAFLKNLTRGSVCLRGATLGAAA